MPGSQVVVAMSGGVDSSVAATLLLKQGYDVVGVTMRLWTVEDPDAPRHNRRCCSVEDTDDARAACDRLGIRHYVLNFEREFAAGGVARLGGEDAPGRPPTPFECVARAAATRGGGPPTRRRTSPTSCMAWASGSWREPYSPWAGIPRRRSGRSPADTGCPMPTSRIPSTSASSPPAP